MGRIEFLPTGVPQEVVQRTTGERARVTQKTEETVKTRIGNVLFEERRKSLLALIYGMYEDGIISKHEYEEAERAGDNIVLTQILIEKGHIFTDTW